MEFKGNLTGTVLVQEAVLADSGAANAYVVTYTDNTAITYASGLRLTFKATYANTGASTLNVNGLGVKSIVTITGAALNAGDIPAGGIVEVIYNGTSFQMVGALAGTIYFDNAYFAGAGTQASPLTVIGGGGGFPVVEVAATYAAISSSTTKRLIQVTVDETNSNALTLYYHNGTGLMRIGTTNVTTTTSTSTSSSTTATTTSGGSYTVERTWNIKGAGQYTVTTVLPGWHFMLGTSDNTIPANTTYGPIRDSTNSTTNSISFVATSLWSGSGGSIGPLSGLGTGSDWGCDDLIVTHAWATSTNASFKLTGLDNSKYYQIGFVSNTYGFQGVTVSAVIGGQSIATFNSSNNYGTCAGDYLTDPIVHWVYNIQPTAGEITGTITKQSGNEAALTALIVLQTNIAKP
jgi:hypothetical protein